MLKSVIFIIAAIIVYVLIERTNKNPKVTLHDIADNIDPLYLTVFMIIGMIIMAIFWE